MNLSIHTKKYEDYAILFVISIPIIYFYRYVVQYAINVPYLDDFQILNIIVRIQHEPQKWWDILSENFNGHRFAEIKALFILDYWLEGQANFKTLCIFGSLFLLGFWLFCFKIIRENNIPIIYLIPFTFILFQPIFHRNIFWMLSCLQYQQSIFFTIAAYYYLAKYTTQSFVISVILGVVHTQINGNAVYIFMLGGLIPLYQGRYKMTAIYWSVGVVTGILFYRNMPTVVGLAGYSLKDLLSSNIGVLLGSLGGFLGGCLAQFTSKYWVIAGFGITLFIIIGLILLLFIILIIKHIVKKNILKDSKSEAILLKYDEMFRQRIIVILVAGSLVLTAIGVAISRGGAYKGVMLVDRYLLYSVVSIGMVYLLFIMVTEGWLRKWIGILITPISLIFCWHSYYKATPEVIYFKNSHEADIYNLKYHRTTNNKMFCFTPDVLKLFNESLAKGIYQFPANRIERLEDKLSQPIKKEQLTNLPLELTFSKSTQNVYSGVTILFFSNKDFKVSESSPDNTFFVVLKNEQNQEAYLIYPYRFTTMRKDFLRTHQRFTTGFTTMIQQDCAKKGHYRIGFLTFEGTKTSLIYTPNFIDINNTQMIDWMQRFGYYQ
ncbi:MAG: hypothetical protein MUF58_11555 [Arcicella sp.]|jgi:hypothetical protein|nr:hypothetical protein [Arcicella sp.]